MKVFRRVRDLLGCAPPSRRPGFVPPQGFDPFKSTPSVTLIGPKKRFEQWNRKRLHRKLRAAGWSRKGLAPHCSRSWQHDSDPLPRSTRNAAKIEGLIP